MKVTWLINPVLGLWPTALLITAALALIVWNYVKSGRNTPFVTTAGYLVLRLIALAALATIAFAPVRVIEQCATKDKTDAGKEGLPVVVLEDVSQSLTVAKRDALSGAARRLLAAAGIKGAEWIAFAGKPGDAGVKGSAGLEPEATDISSALLSAAMYCPGAIVLLSDGAWNKGSDPLVLVRDGDSPPVAALFPQVSDIPPAGFAPPGLSEAGKDTPGITLPETVSAGEEFPVKLRFHPGGAGGRLIVRLKGPLRGEAVEEIPVVMEKRLPISGGTVLEERTVRLAASTSGTWLVEAELRPEGAAAPESVLTQTAVLKARSGPLRVLLFQGRIGWDAAALLRMLDSTQECRVRRVRGYTDSVEPAPEPEEFDIVILCGYPQKGVTPTWKAALVSYLNAGKGIMVAGRAAEYLAWHAACIKLPKMFAAPESGLIETAPDMAVLPPEAAVLLEAATAVKGEAFYGRVLQAEKVALQNAATPIIVGKKTAWVYSTLATAGASRVLWFGEPPFSNIFSRARGDTEELFLDAAYFLGHRKRYAQELRLEVLRMSARPGETVPLLLEGLRAAEVVNLSMTIHGHGAGRSRPGSDTFRSLNLDSIKRKITDDGRLHMRERLKDPGLYVFGITATYRNGRAVQAGTACLVRGRDRERSERGTKKQLLQRLAAESGGASAAVHSTDDFTPPSDMVKLLRKAGSFGPAPARSSVFELYRWWPVILVLLGALFCEWALRTR